VILALSGGYWHLPTAEMLLGGICETSWVSVIWEFNGGGYSVSLEIFFEFGLGAWLTL
jgi:hypothetical protein